MIQKFFSKLFLALFICVLVNPVAWKRLQTQLLITQMMCPSLASGTRSIKQPASFFAFKPLTLSHPPLPDQARSVTYSKKPSACWISPKCLKLKVFYISLPSSHSLNSYFESPLKTNRFTWQASKYAQYGHSKLT